MSISFGLVIYIFVPAFFLMGTILTIVGLRGRRIDDHPWCGKCRFDLFGLDEPKACPECGSDLQQAKRVRIGQRRKRRGLIAFGTIMLLLSIGGGGLFGWAAASDIDWQKQKPVWWLTSEANSAPGATSDAALDELRRRQDAGGLSNAQVKALIETALTHQADKTRTWQTQWGDIVQIGRANNRVTDEQWRRYAMAAADGAYRFSLRSPMTIAGRLTYRVGVGPARVGERIGEQLHRRAKKITFEIAGRIIERSIGGSGVLSASSNGGATTSIPLPDELVEKLKPGELTVKATLLNEISTASQWQAGELIGEIEIEMMDSCELLPRSQRSAKMTVVDQHRTAMRDAIVLKNVQAGQYSSEKKDNLWHVDCQFDITPRPMDIAFNIVLRHDGQEYKRSTSGSLNAEANRSTGYHTSTGLPGEWLGKKVDVILRPSLDVAERSIDCFEIWGEEIVFKDILIEKRE